MPDGESSRLESARSHHRRLLPAFMPCVGCGLCLAGQLLAAVPGDGSETTVKAHARTMPLALGAARGLVAGRRGMQLMIEQLCWRVAHMRTRAVQQCQHIHPVAAPAPQLFFEAESFRDGMASR